MEVQTLQRGIKNDNAFKDRRVFYQGTPETLLLNGKQKIKHQPEVDAFNHAFNPEAIQFLPIPKRQPKTYIPPSVRPDEAWCTGCREYHHVSKFHKDSSRGRGLQYNCIDYRAAQRIAGPRKKQVSDYWYRSPR